MQVVSFRPVHRVDDIFAEHSVTEIDRGRYPQQEVISRASGANALFVHSENSYTSQVIEALESLQVIGKPGAGIEHINVEAATEADVTVLHTPGLNAPAVAEFAVGGLIAFARRMPAAMEHLREGGWRGEEWWGVELRDKTVGLVGLGATGFETAQRLEPFGVDLLVADPYVSDERVEAAGAERASLPELLKRTDVLSLHVKLTEETRGLIGADELEQLPTDALLVNTSRGPVIDREALLDALRNDTIQGAVLDVFHNEPPDPTDPLLQQDNVLVTPHIAAATEKTRVEMLRTTAEKVVRVLDDRPVGEQYLANADVHETR